MLSCRQEGLVTWSAEAVQMGVSGEPLENPESPVRKGVRVARALPAPPFGLRRDCIACVLTSEPPAGRRPTLTVPPGSATTMNGCARPEILTVNFDVVRATYSQLSDG